MKANRSIIGAVLMASVLALPGCAIYADDGAWAHSDVWYEEVGEFFVVASAFTLGVLLGHELGHGYHSGGYWYGHHGSAGVWYHD